MPREAVWVKTVPRAIAEGLTGGRSDFVSSSYHHRFLSSWEEHTVQSSHCARIVMLWDGMG